MSVYAKDGDSGGDDDVSDDSSGQSADDIGADDNSRSDDVGLDDNGGDRLGSDDVGFDDNGGDGSDDTGTDDNGSNDDAFDDNRSNSSRSNIISTANLSREQAIAEALKITPGTVREVEQEMKSGVLVWKVKIVNAAGESSDVRIATNSTGLNSSTGSAALIDPNPTVSRQQAVDRALSISPGTIQRVEQEIEHGVLVWKVRIIGAGGVRSDIRVDATSGSVVRARVGDLEIKNERDDNRTNQTLNTSVTQSAAIAKALSVVPGTVGRVEQETEHGVLVWKVRIVKADGSRADVSIDANTGAAVRTQADADNIQVDVSDDFPSGSGNADTVSVKMDQSMFRKFLQWLGLG